MGDEVAGLLAGRGLALRPDWLHETVARLQRRNQWPANGGLEAQAQAVLGCVLGEDLMACSSGTLPANVQVSGFIIPTDDCLHLDSNRYKISAKDLARATRKGDSLRARSCIAP